MKLSISNIAWRPKDRVKVYNFLKTQEISQIEIAPKLLLNSEKNIFSLNKKIISRYLNELKVYNLRIVSMQSLLYKTKNCFLFGTVKERKNLIDQIKKICILAKNLEIENLVFGSPKNRIIPKTLSNVDVEKIAIETFKIINKIARTNNIILSLEPNPSVYGTNFLNTFKETSILVKKMNLSNVKMILDLGEIQINKNIHNLNYLIRNNIEIINHVHISEPFLKPLTNKKVILKLLRILKKYNYKKFVSIEMRNIGKKSFDNVMNSILLVKNLI